MGHQLQPCGSWDCLFNMAVSESWSPSDLPMFHRGKSHDKLLKHHMLGYPIHPYFQTNPFSSGWWLTYSSETYEVSWEYYSQYNCGKIRHVPNHQPEFVHINIYICSMSELQNVGGWTSVWMLRMFGCVYVEPSVSYLWTQSESQFSGSLKVSKYPFARILSSGFIHVAI